MWVTWDYGLYHLYCCLFQSFFFSFFNPFFLINFFFQCNVYYFIWRPLTATGELSSRDDGGRSRVDVASWLRCGCAYSKTSLTFAIRLLAFPPLTWPDSEHLLCCGFSPSLVCVISAIGIPKVIATFLLNYVFVFLQWMLINSLLSG